MSNLQIYCAIIGFVALFWSGLRLGDGERWVAGFFLLQAISLLCIAFARGTP